MRGVDTNILVRYLAGDDAKQTALAGELMEQSSRRGEQLFIPLIVLCELVWVLSKSYAQTKPVIVRALDEILETKLFQIESDLLVRRSLDAFRTGRGDFADYLIGEICHAADCQGCITMDRGLAGAAGFTLLR